MKIASFTIALGLLLAAVPSLRAEVSFARFNELSQKYCVECHNPADEKGSLDLAVFESEADFKADVHLLEDLEWVIGEKEMPVPSAPKQPTNEERQEMVDWLVQTLMEIQNAMPNDPGEVAMPRISSKEFDYVIEDLTGREYELSKFLTADTAGGEGFYNVGASQQLSVGQFEAFMGVGKMLMDHARYVPGLGIWWMNGPQPGFEKDEALAPFLKEQLERLINREITEEVVNRHIGSIRQETPYREGISAYLDAAWQLRYRSELGMPEATLQEIASRYQPSLYQTSLSKMVAILGADHETKQVLEWRENPYMSHIIRNWLNLPTPNGHGVQVMQKKLNELEKWLETAANQVDSGGAFWGEEQAVEIAPADKPERQQRRGYYHKGEGYLKIDATKLTENSVYLAATGRTIPVNFDPTVVWGKGVVTMKDGRKLPWDEAGVRIVDGQGERLAFKTGSSKGGAHVSHATPGYIRVVLPSDAQTFEVRAMYDPTEADQTRLLRVRPFDTAPDLSDLSVFYRSAAIGRDLEDTGVRRAFKALDDMDAFYDKRWYRHQFSEADLFANESEDVRAYMQTESVAIPESRANYWSNLYSISMQELETEIAKNRVEPWMKRKLRELFTAIRSAVGEKSQDDDAALADKREILRKFVSKAWRGQVSEGEIDDLMVLYTNEKELGASTESALETAMRTALISPKFLYRFTETRQNPEPYVLGGPELATKLAFVLWSGLPDDELLALGESGDIRNPAVLQAQIDRMLADPRSDRFIEEFFGRWLHFADFDGFSGPDQEKFSEWNKRLAKAMHQEAALFVEYLVREDRPITDLFEANYTFLNAELAEHYGVSGVEGSEMRMVQLDDARRGGIIGMGAFLTKTSSPLRTSPVHRGLWLYEDVLDLPVPEPPPVPLLSDDGVDDQGRTIVDQLRQHRDDPACFSCHDRFDPLGVALENFDPIGRWRTRIEDKADVKSQGLFRSGETIDGVAGLRAYLAEREEILIDAFTTKLLGYALGRSVLPTDKPTLDAMKEAMSENNLSVRAALHAALTSPQFLTRRDVELASK